MKILLVQLPTSHLGARERVYPIGLSRLSSLVPGSYEKIGLDMNLQGDPWPALREALMGFRPDAVVLSFRNIDPLGGQQVSYLSSIKTAGKVVRGLAPEARIVAGGPAFSLFSTRLMAEVPEIDLGLIGEGELVFTALIAPSVTEPGTLPGLVWRKGGQIVCNASGPGIPLKDLPVMDVGTFPPLSYLEGNKYVAAMGIEGKRGCDLRCGYCVYPMLGKGRMRLRDPSIIVDEMEFLKKEHSVDLFHFTDSVLNRPADHFEALCEELLRRRLDVRWTGFFREETFTERSAGLARDAGLAACYFSADALTESGLRLLNKGLTKDDILKASKVSVSSGVLTMYHFLLNLPFETEEDLAESRRMVETILDLHHRSGNLGAMIFNNIRLYPGAPMTETLLRAGLLPPGVDLLYPVYFNPPERSHFLHEMETLCHGAGVLSRLGIP